MSVKRKENGAPGDQILPQGEDEFSVEKTVWLACRKVEPLSITRRWAQYTYLKLSALYFLHRFLVQDRERRVQRRWNPDLSLKDKLSPQVA